MKSKADRWEWIRKYIAYRRDNIHREYSVNVLDSDFVCEYADENEVPVGMQFVGAPKCPTLGRDLAGMYKSQILRRQTCGLDGFSGMGFPKWVYDYKL